MLHHPSRHVSSPPQLLSLSLTERWINGCKSCFPPGLYHFIFRTVDNHNSPRGIKCSAPIDLYSSYEVQLQGLVYKVVLVTINSILIVTLVQFSWQELFVHFSFSFPCGLKSQLWKEYSGVWYCFLSLIVTLSGAIAVHLSHNSQHIIR